MSSHSLSRSIVCPLKKSFPLKPSNFPFRMYCLRSSGIIGSSSCPTVWTLDGLDINVTRLYAKRNCRLFTALFPLRTLMMGLLRTTLSRTRAHVWTFVLFHSLTLLGFELTLVTAGLKGLQREFVFFVGFHIELVLTLLILFRCYAFVFIANLSLRKEKQIK